MLGWHPSQMAAMAVVLGAQSPFSDTPKILKSNYWWALISHYIPWSPMISLLLVGLEAPKSLAHDCWQIWSQILAGSCRGLSPQTALSVFMLLSPPCLFLSDRSEGSDPSNRINLEHTLLTLWSFNRLLLKIAIEIVDLPIKNSDFP